MFLNKYSFTMFFFVGASHYILAYQVPTLLDYLVHAQSVCVCVCVREREREREEISSMSFNVLFCILSSSFESKYDTERKCFAINFEIS